MATQHPLTTYLKTSCPASLKSATTSPQFLQAAGSGHLPKPLLSQWLSQDRLYAQSYIRFVGLLLAKIRLPSHNPNSSKPRAATSEQRTVDILIDALVNIRRELKFFEDVAVEFGLDLNAIPTQQAGCGYGEKENSEDGECCGGGGGAGGGGGGGGGGRDGAGNGCFGFGQSGKERGCTVFFGANLITRVYVDLFMSAGSSAVTVLEGMVVLWASEVCYLRAWKFARSVSDECDNGVGMDFSKDEDGGALRQKFIPNWSSAEFEAFVNRIGVVVDDLAQEVKGAEEGESIRGKCLEWWRQVLWLEEKFWPVMKKNN